MHGRADRILPGQADRRRRQAFPRVGVVRGIRLKIGPAQIAVKLLAHPVDGGGVALQHHRAVQPIGEHRGDPHPVGFLSGLFFNDRGQDQRLVGRS